MTTATPDQTATELELVTARVVKGIEWLTEHDPTGAYHLWFKAGLTKLSPMPAKTEEEVAAWKAYYDNRVLFEALWTKMERLEAGL